jgi:predicted phosphoadenosine phosphosulfate sulfurtransferase
MTRQRMFLDISCVDAARQRIRHVYDTFDSVCIQFSGGKDSSAVLYLAKEIHEERGLGPVTVIFRDEEIVSPSVLEYVEYVRSLPWVNMEWYCLPEALEVWSLGRRMDEMSWSEQRMKEGRLFRPIPDHAITAYHFGLDHASPIPEHVDYYTTQGKKGNIAFITGVRAAESMIRYRSCVQKLHENYIVTPYKSKKGLPVKFAKIIYDWQVNDVFKFLDEHNAPYCEYYDLATLTGSNNRVGVPLHSVAIRRIGDVIATEPEYYDRLYECFPVIDAQRRWWPDFDIEALIRDTAAQGWNGVKPLIEQYIWGEGSSQRAMSYAAEFRKKHAKDPYSYPMEWLIRNLLLGELGGLSVSPVGPKTRAHTLRLAAAQQEEDGEKAQT